MKPKKLGEISPYFFENRLIISLSKEWMRLFKELPKFKVILDRKNQLVLQGPIVKIPKTDFLFKESKIEGSVNV